MVARDRLLDALGTAGWVVVRGEAVSGREQHSNPMRLDLRRGRQRRRLLLYAWRAVHEGKGRARYEMGAPRYRVQTTRSHDGNLLTEPGRVSVGIGWHQDWDVFFAFDLWAKRFTGKSSSVYVEPEILQEALQSGHTPAVREDCLELAFTPAGVDALLPWLDKLQTRRTMTLHPQFVHDAPDGESMRMVVDTRRRTRVTWLRSGDYVVLHDGNALADGTLWRIKQVWGAHESGKRNRVLVHLDLHRWGIVHCDEWMTGD